jgi:hypothetical protein
MAVSVQIPYSSSPSMWHLKQPAAAFPTDFDGPTDNALYYNAGPLEPSSVIPMYHHSVSGEQSPITSVESPVLSKYHDSTSLSKNSKIKRSISTPNVRGQASSDVAHLALSADKRRNKLGYHRTSVACGIYSNFPPLIMYQGADQYQDIAVAVRSGVFWLLGITTIDVQTAYG